MLEFCRNVASPIKKRYNTARAPTRRLHAATTLGHETRLSHVVSPIPLPTEAQGVASQHADLGLEELVEGSEPAEPSPFVAEEPSLVHQQGVLSVGSEKKIRREIRSGRKKELRRPSRARKERWPCTVVHVFVYMPPIVRIVERRVVTTGWMSYRFFSCGRRLWTDRSEADFMTHRLRLRCTMLLFQGQASTAELFIGVENAGRPAGSGRNNMSFDVSRERCLDARSYFAISGRGRPLPSS